MVLKWAGALVAVAAGSCLVTMAVAGVGVPVAAVLTLLAVSAGSLVLVAMAELYQRLDARVGLLSDFLVARLADISGRLEQPDRGDSAAALEALLKPDEGSARGGGAAIVPLIPRRTGR